MNKIVGLLKIKVFWNKIYDVIISIHEVSNKIISRELNYIVHLLMWPKFGNCNISMKELLTTSILQGFDQKNNFFEGCFWFKLNNLGLTIGMALKFSTSAVKGLKLKVRSHLRLHPSFVEVTGEKLVGKHSPPSWIGLKLCWC